MLLHDPVLDVLGDDLFGVLDVVSGPKDERRWVFPHAGVLVSTDHQLVATTKVATFTKDHHPNTVQRLNELVHIPEDGFVLSDSTLSFLEHTAVVTRAAFDETPRAGLGAYRP